MKYNIAIIEDNLDLRRELSDFFSTSDKLDCVMAVDSIEKFLKYHRDFYEIKLILLDVMLHNQSSIYSIPHLLQREPEVEIIMFTVDDNSNTIFQALTYGATGYLLKDITFPALEASLYSVLQGEGALLSPAVSKKIIQSFIPKVKSRNNQNEDEELSEKEQTVCHLLKDGHSYDEIAQRMGLTTNGVRYYIKSIYRKLRVKNRGQLIRLRFEDK